MSKRNVLPRFGCDTERCATQTVVHVSGRTSNSVMDTGDGVSHISPIYESFALHHAIFVWLATRVKALGVRPAVPARKFVFLRVVRSCGQSSQDLNAFVLLPYALLPKKKV